MYKYGISNWYYILHLQIIIREEAREVQVNDNAVQTPVLQKAQHMMRADDDVMALPRYNKPKKSNNAQIMTQGEPSLIETYFFNLNN